MDQQFSLRNGVYAHTVIKNISKRLDVYSQIKQMILTNGSVVIVGVVAFKTTGDISFENIKSLLAGVDILNSLSLLYDNLENQAAIYIKGLKADMLRIMFPTYVHLWELRGNNEHISGFHPVLDGLYVDLAEVYGVYDEPTPVNQDTSDSLNPNSSDSENNPSLLKKIIGTVLGVVFSIALLSVKLTLIQPIPTIFS